MRRAVKVDIYKAVEAQVLDKTISRRRLSKKLVKLINAMSEAS